MAVPTVNAGNVHRSYQNIVDAGGKGLNVARAVLALGGRPTCAGFLGGLSGQRVATLAAAEGFAGAWTDIAEETRTCVIITAEDGSDATVFNEHGPTVTDEEWAQLQRDVVQAGLMNDVVCLSGSLPDGASEAGYQTLIRLVEGSRRPVWVDTSGRSLRAAIEAQPTTVKINDVEAGEIVGETIRPAQEAAVVAESFRNRGVSNVVITLGEEGAVLVTADGAWWAKPPELQMVSTVASGDCFLAGMVVAVSAGEPMERALMHGVAAGSANAISTGGAHFTIQQFEDVLAGTTICKLDS